MLFIFDWDGTLIDSADKIIRCMRLTADSLSMRPLDAAEIKNIIGLGLPEAIRQLYPTISDVELNAFISAYSKYFVIEDQVPCSFFEGVEDSLQELLKNGHLIAVATGKSRRGLSRVLSNVNMINLFHSTRCADETASKPDPLMLFEIMEELGCDRNESVMIGDTEYDMQMAVNAGVARIAVDYGAHAIDRLQPYGPLKCLSQFAQLLEWAESESILG